MGQLTDQEFIQRAEELANQVAKFDEHRMAKSDPEIPITDILTVYEGLLNQQEANYTAEYSDLETVEVQHTVNLIDDGSGMFKVLTSEAIGLYNDCVSEIGSHVDFTSGEDIKVTDLKLLHVDPLTMKATFAQSVVKGLVPYMIPGEPYWASELKGPCTSNSYVGVDAATFISAYANRTIDYPNCAPSQSVLVVNLYAYTINETTWRNVPNFISNSLYNTTSANMWKGHQNGCIGNNNLDWHNWYRKFDNIANAYKNHVNTLFPGQNLKFTYTNWHSHNAGSPNNGWYDNASSTYFQYYHEGILGYGVIICQP